MPKNKGIVKSKLSQLNWTNKYKYYTNKFQKLFFLLYKILIYSVLWIQKQVPSNNCEMRICWLGDKYARAFGWRQSTYTEQVGGKAL